MNPFEYLPAEFRLPANGDSLSVQWVGDIGGDVRADRIGRYLNDLQVVLDLGEKWGLAYAETASLQAFELELSRRGPSAVNEVLRSWSLQIENAPDIEMALLDPEYFYFRRWRRVRYGRDPFEIERLLASGAVPALMGRPLLVRHVEYNNPIEIILAGAGLVLVGTVKLLRMVRDWSSQRRIGNATADAAEAAARQAQTAADVGEWLVAEAQAGRLHVPVGELMRYVSPADLDSMHRLADSDIQLGLPGPLQE